MDKIKYESPGYVKEPLNNVAILAHLDH
jgi:hypothetical protein